MEEQIADVLYYAELRQGAWAIDVGGWGPASFRKEAARILAGMRPEFGFLIEEGETAQELWKQGEDRPG